jgi:hypothetical protein
MPSDSRQGTTPGRSGAGGTMSAAAPLEGSTREKLPWPAIAPDKCGVFMTK